jgi:hypothetical protein
MRDVTRESIEFKNDCSFLSLGDELWGGAKERWQGADDATKVAVWDRIRDWIDAVVLHDGELPSMTQINDIIWFDCDDQFYPTSFTVKVYRADENGERDPRFAPLYEKTFDGMTAEQDARAWWQNENDCNVGGAYYAKLYRTEMYWDWTGEVVAFLCNETDGSEEEL